MTMQYSKDVKDEAKEMFLKGVSFRDIAKNLNIKNHLTVYRWSKQQLWSGEKGSSAAKSLKKQLDTCTKLVNNLRSAVNKIDVTRPNKKEREVLMNFNKYSNLQLKLIKQLEITNPKKTPKITGGIFS